MTSGPFKLCRVRHALRASELAGMVRFVWSDPSESNFKLNLRAVAVALLWVPCCCWHVAGLVHLGKSQPSLRTSSCTAALAVEVPVVFDTFDAAGVPCAVTVRVRFASAKSLRLTNVTVHSLRCEFQFVGSGDKPELRVMGNHIALLLHRFWLFRQLLFSDSVPVRHEPTRTLSAGFIRTNLNLRVRPGIIQVRRRW